MAARNGQPVTLEWCIRTWKNNGKHAELTAALNQVDHQGMTPLVAACYKGQLTTRFQDSDADKCEDEKTRTKQLR